MPAPVSTSQKTSSEPIPLGTPCAAVKGATIANPTSITHASTEDEPISRVARAAVSAAVAQQTAAPRPPRTAVNYATSWPSTPRSSFAAEPSRV